MLDARTARRLRGELVAFFDERLADHELAEDLAQEALVRLLRATRRRRRVIESQVRRIAATLLREQAQRGAGAVVPRTLPPNALDRYAWAPPPQHLLDLRTTQQCLVGAFGLLPIDVRRLVMLHDLAEIPLKEVAATFGCTATSAKIQLRRAHTRLAEICRAECESETGPDGVLLCLPKEGSAFAVYDVMGGRGRASARPAPRPPRSSRRRG